MEMAKDFSQVNFRMPTDLKEKLEEASKVNDRSLTSEVVSRLEDSFKVDGKQPIYLPENNMRELNALMTLSLGSIIKGLLYNDVPIEVIRKSFPSGEVFQGLIDILIKPDALEDEKKAP